MKRNGGSPHGVPPFFSWCQPTVLADSALTNTNNLTYKIVTATAPNDTGAATKNYKNIHALLHPVDGAGNEKPHGRPSRESRAAFIVKLFFVVFPEAVAFAG